MPTVFISYAREDQAFVRELDAALPQRGIDVWTDWQGIPPSADYFEEIKHAIEGADAVLVVLSPDLAASRVCGQELAHAIAAQKRLIPILRRSTPSETLDSAIRRLNWIQFREKDDPAVALDAVAAAIETDLDWVSLHTRLLVRALEWEQRGHDASLLLRGQPLREAEEWLAESDPGKDPQPTHAQGQFLLASRRAATNRQRQLIGAAALAVVISLALAAMALIQRQHAIDQRGIAETQRGIAVAQKAEADAQRAEAEKQRAQAQTEAALARSRELAATSASLLATDPELSIRLAMEALDVASTHEAETALRQALGASHVRRSLEDGANVSNLGWSADGTAIYASDYGGTLRAWNAATGAALWTSQAAPASVASFAISPDGKLLAGGGANGTLRLLDAATGKETDLDGGKGILWSVAFSPDGRLVAASSGDGAVRVWEVASGALAFTLDGGHGELRALAFSPGGTLLAAGAWDGAALLWSLPEGKLAQTLIPSGRPAENYPGEYSLSRVRFSPNGEQLLTSSYDGSARLWDVATGEFKLAMQNRPLINTLRPFVSDALFSPDGALIATGSSDGVVRLWDASTGEREADLRGLLDFVIQLAFSPDGSRIAAASFDGTARVWDVVSGSATAVLAGHAGYVSTVSFDPAGARVATGSQDATVRVWEAATGAIAATFGSSSQQGLSGRFAPDGSLIVADANGAATIYDLATGTPRAPATVIDPKRFAVWWRGAISPDGKWLALSDLATPHVLLWNVATGAAGPELAGHTGTVQNLAWSPDGRLLATPSNDKTVRVWDAATGKSIRTLTFELPMAAAAFSPDGRWLAVAGASGVFEVWDVTTWAKLRDFHGGTNSNYYSLAFNADGSRLVTGAGNNTATVWDPATGALLVELRGHVTPVTAVAFSPDGQQVISGDQSGEVRVWDIQSGQTLATMRDASSEIRAVAMSLAGRQLLVVPQYGPARVTACDVCGTVDNLLAVAKARGTRELTPDERRRYLGEAVAATPVASPVASPEATPLALPVATPIG